MATSSTENRGGWDNIFKALVAFEEKVFRSPLGRGILVSAAYMEGKQDVRDGFRRRSEKHFTSRAASQLSSSLLYCWEETP